MQDSKKIILPALPIPHLKILLFEIKNTQNLRALQCRHLKDFPITLTKQILKIVASRRNFFVTLKS